MNQAQEQFRVTSVQDRHSRLVTFRGVPLLAGSEQRKSGQYNVSVTTLKNSLPVSPSVGQHWQIIGGQPQVEAKVFDGYVIDEHHYNDFDSLVCSLPEDGEQFIQFIANNSDFIGIGEGKARKLWNVFGTGLHGMLADDEETSRKALREILTSDSVDALYQGYSKYKNLAHCNWLSQHKVPAHVQRRLLKHHDDQAVVELQKNPYLLISFGLSFAATDDSARSIWGVSVDDDRRLAAAMQAALIEEVDKGHTYATKADLRPTLRKLLGSSELAKKALAVGRSQAQYLVGPEGHFHPTGQYVMETVIARRLMALAASPGQMDLTTEEEIERAVNDLAYPLTEKQREAVERSVEHGLSCIVGGAGTGKTTVLRTVLKVYQALGYDIYPVALSGRAAMRLRESTGFDTSTIAKLLRGQPIDSEKALVVIDEASMVDVPTLYRLVTHINPSVRLLLVGDPNQLPPIGCGRVLADVVDSGCMHATELDIVQRQSDESGIPGYSMAVNDGHPPKKLTQGSIIFHETPRDQISAVCADLYCESPSSSRVMASTKKLVAEINQKIQTAVNPNGRRMVFEIDGDALYRDDLREGDAVLFTENHYAEGVQNGSLGVLSSVETTESTYGCVRLDTGQDVELSQALMDCMELGYAITLHKAQGSQFPRVIVGLGVGNNHSRSLIDRAWIYTAITRAEAEVHLVGREENFRAIVEAESKSMLRRSYLTTLLKSA